MSKARGWLFSSAKTEKVQFLILKEQKVCAAFLSDRKLLYSSYMDITEVKEDFQFAVPLSVIKLIPATGQLEVRYKEGIVTFRLEGVSVQCQELNYTPMLHLFLDIQVDCPKWSIPAKELAKLSNCGNYASDEYQFVLHLDAEKIELYTQTLGGKVKGVRKSYESKDFKGLPEKDILLSIDYVKQLAAVFPSGETITIYQMENSSPVIFESESIECMIMPMRGNANGQNT